MAIGGSVKKINKCLSDRAFCLDRLIPSPYSLTLTDASYKGLRQQVSGIDREVDDVSYNDFRCADIFAV
ncbi:MAG: hypothetical protein ACKPHU_12300, partial [Planctomycetaceae bacterium]